MASVSWKSGVSASWNTAADWSTGLVPGAADDVTIAAAGTYAVNITAAAAAHSLVLNAAGATVSVGSTLTMGGTITLTAGTMRLNAGGIIAGGTIARAGGAFQLNGGTLSGVGFQGTLDLSQTSSSATILNGITLAGANGSGAGTVNLKGFNSRLSVAGNTTLDNATVSIGNNAGYSVLYAYDSTGAGAVLTLGSQLNLVQTGTYAYLQDSGSTSDGVVNNGSLSARVSGGQFSIQGNSFSNAGRIDVSNGDSLTVGSAQFSNTGSISVYAATLAFSGSWSNTGTISASYNAVVNLGGAFTLAQLGTIQVSIGAAVQISGTLDNSGGTLNAGTGTTLGTVVVQGGGTISNGVVHDAGGGFVWQGGTLSGVTYRGTLDLSASFSIATILNGITLTGANGSGAGTVNLKGNSSRLHVAGNTTLDNATVSIGNNAGYSVLYAYDSTGAGAVLTLGSQLNLVQTGTFVHLQDSGSTSDGVVNNGSLSAGVSGGQFFIDGNSFSNAGGIGVSNGDRLSVLANHFGNTGTIIVNAATLALSGSWSNAGTISASNNAVVNLGGAFTLAQLATIQFSTGAALRISGALDNSGGTLNTGTGTTLGTVSLLNTGTIGNGVVQDAGGGGLLVQGGTLSGVTYRGTLDLSADSSNATILNGITLTGGNGSGAGTVNLKGNGSHLSVAGNTTLDNATVNIGNSVDYSYLYAYDYNGAGSLLTLGSQLNLMQTGRYAYLLANGYAADGVVNNGSLSAGVSGGQFSIQGNSFRNAGSISVSNGDSLTVGSSQFSNAGTISVNAATLALSGSWSNAGTISASNNAVVIFGGAFTLAQLATIQLSTGAAVQISGTLDNSGGTLNAGTGTALGTVVVQGGGTISNGVVQDAGGGFVWQGGTLSGVTYRGTLDLSASSSTATILNGITLTGANSSGAGTVNLKGFNSRLSVAGNTTLDNATVSIGNNAGYSVLYAYDSTGAGAVLTLGSQLNLVQTGTYAYLQGSGYASDGVVNNGSLSAGVSGGQFNIIGNSFSNAGRIGVSNGDSLTVSTSHIKNFSASALNGGAFEVDAGSTLTLYNVSAPNTDNANIILSGAGSVFQIYNTTKGTYVALDSSLTTIGAAGALHLQGGRNFTGAMAFTDQGLLDLHGSSFVEASLTVAAGGSLFGFGTVTGAVTDSGTVEANGGLLTLATGLSGSGAAQVDAGASLEIAGSTATGVAFNGLNATLVLDAPSGYTGTLSGLAAGSRILLKNTAANSAAFGGGKLTIGLSGGGTLAYAQSGSVANLRVATAASGADTLVLVYRTAQPSANTPEPVAFGNQHVGDVVTQALTLSNLAPADGWSEKLDASLGGATTGISASGGITALAAGASDGGSLVVGLTTAASGAVSASATIALSSDGAGVDGLAALALGAQTVNVTGAVYAYATASLLPASVDFGVVHVGDTVSRALALSNTAATGGFSEALDAALTGGGGAISASGSLSLLAAGAADTTHLLLGLNTGTSGNFASTGTLALSSDGTGIDGLGSSVLAGQTVNVTGTVDNYATAAIQDVAGGTLTQSGTSYTLDLGTAVQGGTALSATLSVLNAAGGLADLLAGGFTISGSSDFANSGFVAFSGLGAGQADTPLGISLGTGGVGVFTETIVLTATGSNGSGYSAALAGETLSVTGTITGGQTYTLTTGADRVAGTPYNDTIIATGGALSTGDSIDGGGGTNTLVLQSGGTFDLRKPTTLGNVQLLQAQDGQPAGGGVASQQQTVYLRKGLDLTVNVLPATINPADPQPAGIIIHGAADHSVINLSTGKDTVYLGGVGETANGGGGADRFFVSAATIGATIDGGTGKSILQVAGGGTLAMGVNITRMAGVVLGGPPAGGTQAAYAFTANALAGLAITGSGGADTITVAAASQSVNANGGAIHVLVSAVNAGAKVTGAAGAVLEITTGGTATLNGATSAVTVQLDQATVLTLSKATFISAFGSTGNDTIKAAAINQTLTGGLGNDTLVGFTGGGDTFLDTTAGLTGDTIRNWLSGDRLDLTDMGFATLQPLGYAGNASTGKLTVTDGSHTAVINFTGALTSSNFTPLGDDGHGGTLIGWHS